MGRPPVDEVVRFAREVHLAGDEDARAQKAVELAAEMITACDGAGVLLTQRHGLLPGASSGDLASRADRLQLELGEGPAWEAVTRSEPVCTTDLGREGRWPDWCAAVSADVGVRTTLAIALSAGEKPLGVLTLHARAAGAFGPDDLATGRVLAALVAVAVADARQISQRGAAMISRTTIGQAQGLLMERYRLDPDQAFEVLRRFSQNGNRKLHAVATELVTTRNLPEVAHRTGSTSE